MPHILKNKHLEIHIDGPDENYTRPRFDRTGKITEVTFTGKAFTKTERNDHSNPNEFGRGLYNEFGIDAALGFDETPEGDWFHKIGVGLLKKEGTDYSFLKNYEIKPAEYDIQSSTDKLSIACISPKANGYAYILKKDIVLKDSSLFVEYQLENTGDKEIRTDEYCHNFLAIDKEQMESNYQLKFPFDLHQEQFGETVNPEAKVDIHKNHVSFNDTPEDPFFFSNLTGGKSVSATWELIHTHLKLGIRETGSFKTHKINLWGWKHVISPELFHKIILPPSKKTTWFRRFDFFTVL